MKQTYDPQACDLLKKFDHRESDKCYEYVSEVKLDKNLCNQVVDPNRQVWCKAMVSLDPKICYDSIRDDYDKALYPRSVETCLSDLVLRTKDPKPCLDISNSDWGDSWITLRNSCISNAEYNLGLNDNKKQRQFCNIMIQDTGKFGDDYYEDCLQNEFILYYPSYFPPRGKVK